MRILSPVPLIGFIAALLVLLSLPAVAEKGVTPGYDKEIADYLQTEGEMVEPSLVSVETRFVKTVNENGTQREVLVAGDFATGFIFNREGIVVTSYTAIQHPPSSYYSSLSGQPGAQADYIRVHLVDGRTYEAEVKGLDGPTGLAVLKILRIAPKDSVPAPFGKFKDVVVGEPIMFMGYNEMTRGRIGYDFGIISALRPKFPTVEKSVNQYIQVNVPQNQGNRGGVLINVEGKVIAVMTGNKPYPDATEIHFGMPIDTVVEVVNAILDDGKMHRAWMGYNLLEMNPQIERAYSIIGDLTGDGLVTDADRDIFKKKNGIDLKHCLFVIYVDPESPAANTGLREADILLEYNGVPVTDLAEMLNEFEKYNIGDTITVNWKRREYAVWDPMVGSTKIEYHGQREDEEKAAKEPDSKERHEKE
jgi:serine protease Do